MAEPVYLFLTDDRRTTLPALTSPGERKIAGFEEHHTARQPVLPAGRQLWLITSQITKCLEIQGSVTFSN